MEWGVEYNPIQDVWHVDDLISITEHNLRMTVKKRENYWVLMAIAETYEEAEKKIELLKKAIQALRILDENNR